MKKMLMLFSFLNLFCDYTIYNKGDKNNFLYVFDEYLSSSVGIASGGECLSGYNQGNLISIFIPINLSSFYGKNTCSSKGKTSSDQTQYLPSCPYYCNTTISDYSFVNGSALSVSPICQAVGKYIVKNFSDPESQTYNTFEYVNCSSGSDMGYCAVLFEPNKKDGDLNLSIDTDFFLGKKLQYSSPLPQCLDANGKPSNQCTLYGENGETVSASFNLNLQTLQDWVGQFYIDSSNSSPSPTVGYFKLPPDKISSASKSLFSSETDLIIDNNKQKAVNIALSQSGYSAYPPLGSQSSTIEYYANQLASDTKAFDSLKTAAQNFFKNMTFPPNNFASGSLLSNFANNHPNSFWSYMLYTTCLNSNIFYENKNNLSNFNIFMAPNLVEKFLSIGLDNAAQLLGTLYGKNGSCSQNNSDIKQGIEDFKKKFALYLFYLVKNNKNNEAQDAIKVLTENFPNLYSQLSNNTLSKEDFINKYKNSDFINYNCCFTYNVLIKSLEHQFESNYKNANNLSDGNLPCLGQVVQAKNGQIYVVYTCSTMDAFIYNGKGTEYDCTFTYKASSDCSQNSSNGCTLELVQSYCSFVPYFAFSNQKPQSTDCKTSCNLNKSGALLSASADTNFLQYFAESDLFNSAPSGKITCNPNSYTVNLKGGTQ